MENWYTSLDSCNFCTEREEYRLLSHFLKVSVFNAYILYNLNKPDSKLTSIEFMDIVIKALANLDKSYNWGGGSSSAPCSPRGSFGPKGARCAGLSRGS